MQDSCKEEARWWDDAASVCYTQAAGGHLLGGEIRYNRPVQSYMRAYFLEGGVS